MKRPASLLDIGQMPKLDETMKTLFDWLVSKELVGEGSTMDLQSEDLKDAALLDGASMAIAQATGRREPSRRKTQKEMKDLKERFKDRSPVGVTQEAVWGAVRDPATSVRALNWQKLPADAMAFYRPFHFRPFDQWGIYLLVGPLLDYHGRLQAFSSDLKLYSPEVLMHLVLFEIFNHEFFHHLAESTATSLEILSAAQGNVQPVYLTYRQAQRSTGFDYPHAPLEEALANAYAHNALSFISRIKAGYKTATIKSYQEAIKQHWHLEPAGYRDAAFYIDSAYVAGGAHLLAQMLGDPGAVNVAPLSCLAKHLMPNGFTALLQKPDIPTYLVGSDQALAAFAALVPAPNEAYTQLFWPFNSQAIDAFVAQKQEEEKAKRKAAPKGSKNARQGELDLSQ
ncbi:hypothetical protein [uncultured Thiodictyon sp.]|uniref:hypothetical protein n=1 Tax=uncultured Thiodictyon sp. TaxID=1846217 RepID=UPI0025DC0512|nr:hypothetical protein [uncultured Thiodictyon sp.]